MGTLELLERYLLWRWLAAVNIISALTITHAVLLLLCSITGIVTSVKTRLTIGTSVSITNPSPQSLIDLYNSIISFCHPSIHLKCSLLCLGYFFSVCYTLDVSNHQRDNSYCSVTNQFEENSGWLGWSWWHCFCFTVLGMLKNGNQRNQAELDQYFHTHPIVPDKVLISLLSQMDKLKY